MNNFESKYWQLHSHELFFPLSALEIKDLFEITELRRCRQGEIIYAHNKEIDRIYLLIQGRLKIACQTQKRADVVLEILKEGDIFGELTLKRSENRQCEFAEVLSRTAIICSFKLCEFEKFIRQDPAITVTFSRMVAEKLKTLSSKYCDLVFKNVKERVLNFFKLHAHHEGVWTGNKVEIYNTPLKRDHGLS